jgi:hypothetical protein
LNELLAKSADLIHAHGVAEAVVTEKELRKKG